MHNKHNPIITLTPKTNIKATNPIHSIQPTTSTPDPFSRLVAIEQRLNRLCCEHDSYMPLLDLYHYTSAYSRWENMIKNVNKKLNEYEGEIHNKGKEC